MNLKIKKVHPEAFMPIYATPGAACFDIAYCGSDVVRVAPGRPLTLATGLAFEVPDGFVMLVFSRSGHGFKHDVRLANCVGVIDSDYRGELLVRLTNDQAIQCDGSDLFIRFGDRIAQAMIVPATQWNLQEVDELSATQRGTGGFGSTGA